MPKNQTYFNLDEAKKHIKELTNRRKMISTSKLRGLLSPINHLYTKLHQQLTIDLPENILQELSYLKVKFYYESGRDKDVKYFIEKTKLVENLEKVIKTRTKESFLAFTRYFEALVAYAKYYGGED